MMNDDLSLPDIEMAMRDPNADHAALRAIEHDLLRDLCIVEIDAEVALDHPNVFRDYRGALLAYVVGTARLHGRTTARQLAVLLEQREPRFVELMFRALGVAIA